MILATPSRVGVITTKITDPVSQLVITVEGMMTATLPALKIETKEVALRGPRGPSAVEAQISADPDNRLKEGTDGGLYVADTFIPDPLAYYLLERGII
jgi:hypothetical protein